MKRASLRTPEEWKKVVDEQGKACKKLNEIIKEKNQKIYDLNKELKHYKSYSRSLELKIEKMENLEEKEWSSY